MKPLLCALWNTNQEVQYSWNTNQDIKLTIFSNWNTFLKAFVNLIEQHNHSRNVNMQIA